MLMIGCDSHTWFLQIAMLDSETGGADGASVGTRHGRGQGVLGHTSGTGTRGDGSERIHSLVRKNARGART